jgi:hypothetical protein
MRPFLTILLLPILLAFGFVWSLYDASTAGG